MAEADRAIKGFLYPRMYRHAAHHAHHGRGRSAWCATCSRATRSGPHDMPAEWAQGVEAGDEAGARCAGSPISSPA